MKNQAIRITIIFTIIFCFLFSQGDTAVAASENNLEYLQSVMEMIKEKYKGEITDEKLIEGALKGMFGTMDPYTQFFSNEEADSFFSSLSNSYFGVGIMIEKQGDYVVVIKVFSGSPAELSGVLPGDKIYKVEGISMVGASTDEVASKVRGPEGTKVKVEFIRGTSEKLLKEIQRAKIEVSPVNYEIKGNIGYIKLDSFSSDSSQYITKALREMDAKNIKKIILDLRNNGGGYVDQAVAIARNFVPKGLITTLDFKSEEEKDEIYRSYLEKIKYEVVVLVNGMSASASEILAGAIQDTGAGTLVGTKTFGKAKVQTFVPILKPEAFEKYSKQIGVQIVDSGELAKYGISPLESEIQGYSKITTGLYTTPKGRMIDLSGLTPDISIPDPVVSKNIDVRSIQKLSKAGTLKKGQEGMDILNAEKILTLLNYKINTPDPILDSKTLQALKDFQKINKLTIHGNLDVKTQEKLNEKLDKLVITIDKQYAKALEILSK